MCLNTELSSAQQCITAAVHILFILNKKRTPAAGFKMCTVNKRIFNKAERKIHACKFYIVTSFA